VQYAYSAPCRFFADDVARTNRINWYFVPDDTPIYEEPHVFTQGLMHADVDDDGHGEPTAIRTRLRKHTRGLNTWGTEGLHVHGDADDFLRRSPRSKYHGPDGQPANPCHAQRFDLHGFSVWVIDNARDLRTHNNAHGFTISDGPQSWNVYADKHGYKVGSKDYVKVRYHTVDKHGWKLGTKDAVFYFDGFPVRDGFKVGTLDYVKVRYSTQDKHGFAFGTADVVRRVDLVSDKDGFLLGTGDVVTTISRVSDDHGFEFGVVDVVTMVPTFNDLHGFELGTVDVVTTFSRALDDHGFKFGTIDAHKPNGITTDVNGFQVGMVETLKVIWPLSENHGFTLGTRDAVLNIFRFNDTHGCEFGMVDKVTAKWRITDVDGVVFGDDVHVHATRQLLCVVTFGDPLLSAAGGIDYIEVGDTITGFGIPAGAVVASLIFPNKIVMDRNANNSGFVPLVIDPS